MTHWCVAGLCAVALLTLGGCADVVCPAMHLNVCPDPATGAGPVPSPGPAPDVPAVIAQPSPADEPAVVFPQDPVPPGLGPGPGTAPGPTPPNEGEPRPAHDPYCTSTTYFGVERPLVEGDVCGCRWRGGSTIELRIVDGVCGVPPPPPVCTLPETWRYDEIGAICGCASGKPMHVLRFDEDGLYVCGLRH